MKKNLWLLAALCAVLGGVFALTRYTPASGKTENKNLAVPQERVAKVEVQNQYGSYGVVRTGEGYALAGAEAVPLSSVAAASLFRQVAAISYHDVMAENLEKKGDFGLASPAATAVVHLQDGGSYTLTLGGKFPVGQGVYFGHSGQGRIFGTQFAQNFDSLLRPKEELVSPLLFPQSGGAGLEDLTAIHWQRGGQAYAVATETGGFVLSAPTPHTLGEEEVDRLLTPLLQLSGREVVAVSLTQGQRKQYGFTGGFSVEIQLNGQALAFEIGNQKGGASYVLLENGVCHLVANKDLALFL